MWEDDGEPVRLFWHFYVNIFIRHLEPAEASPLDGGSDKGQKVTECDLQHGYFVFGQPGKTKN